MPDPASYDDQDSWMSACVPMMMDEGREQDQAVAACLSMWRNKSVKAGPPRPDESREDFMARCVTYEDMDEESCSAMWDEHSGGKSMNRAWSILTIKTIDQERREIEGVASTPTVDRVGDIVEPMGGNFSLPMPLLWQHNHEQPVGQVVAAKSTKNGIPVKAKLVRTDEPGKLKELLDFAWQSVKLGLVRGLSIGFKPREFVPLDVKDPFGGLHYTVWDWYELSLVTVPAQAEATITVIKSVDQGLPLPEPKKGVVVRLPRPAIRLTDTPVKKLKHRYMAESQISVLRATGAKNIQVHWSSMSYQSGEPLYLVSYSD